MYLFIYVYIFIYLCACVCILVSDSAGARNFVRRLVVSAQSIRPSLGIIALSLPPRVRHRQRVEHVTLEQQAFVNVMSEVHVCLDVCRRWTHSCVGRFVAEADHKLATLHSLRPGEAEKEIFWSRIAKMPCTTLWAE